MKTFLVAWAALLCACGEETQATKALFLLPDRNPGAEYYALPFPNDLRVRTDGTLDLDAHPRPNALLEEWIDAASSEFMGFGTNSAIFVRFSAPIDPSSLPGSPTASMQEGASVYLVNIDPDSPNHGKRTPLKFRFEHYAGVSIGDDWLSSLPYPGLTLDQETRYALVVTNRVVDANGRQVAASPDFVDTMAEGATADAALQAARAAYASLGGYLDEAGGDERADVVDAAVFTTGDFTSGMGRIRRAVYDLPAPTSTDVGETGSNATFKTFEGTYSAPNFQSGDVPYDDVGSGKISFDKTGRAIIDHMETGLRFAVTVPAGEVPLRGWPVVLYAHGTGGNYRGFIDDGTARRMAEQGLAAVSIDQVLHGPRNPGGNPEIEFINFLNPIAGRDNARQGAADDFSLVRLVEGLSIPDGARLHTFDGNKIYFMGHSQGGITGPPFLAYEPKVKAAVLSASGGLISLSLLYKTQPTDVSALVAGIIRDYPLDEFNNLLAIVQMFADPSDPVNYGALLVKALAEGVSAKDIYMSEGVVDHIIPMQNIEAMGVATGLSPILPLVAPPAGFTVAGVAALPAPTSTAPISGNMNGHTGVFCQYDAAGGEGHFVVFFVAAAEQQHAEFLGTAARDGRAKLVSPSP